MIEGIKSFYEQFSEFIQEAISEDWDTAKLEAIFFEGMHSYEGEYTRKSDGRERSFPVQKACARAIRELRKSFKDSGQPIWGTMCFELDSNGKFRLNFGYDGCDENGNVIYDDEVESRRNADRHRRLTRL